MIHRYTPVPGPFPNVVFSKGVSRVGAAAQSRGAVEKTRSGCPTANERGRVWRRATPSRYAPGRVRGAGGPALLG